MCRTPKEPGELAGPRGWVHSWHRVQWVVVVHGVVVPGVMGTVWTSVVPCGTPPGSVRQCLTVGLQWSYSGLQWAYSGPTVGLQWVTPESARFLENHEKSINF